MIIKNYDKGLVRMTKASIKVIHERVVEFEPHLLAALEPLFLIPTHITFEERLALFELAGSLPPEFIAIEIGSYVGASSSFIACAASFLKGHLHCIDTWRNDAMTELGQETHADFHKHTYPYRHLITAHRGYSNDAAANTPDNVDLVFIDGDHSYKSTKSDLENYAPKLRTGGTLILHDTNRAEVQQAFSEYAANKQFSLIREAHTLKAYKYNG